MFQPEAKNELQKILNRLNQLKGKEEAYSSLFNNAVESRNWSLCETTFHELAENLLEMFEWAAAWFREHEYHRTASAIEKNYLEFRRRYEKLRGVPEHEEMMDQLVDLYHDLISFRSTVAMIISAVEEVYGYFLSRQTECHRD